ncbi:hypothetical protein [Dactylosporangium sp. CA-233914]|uniref:hypothetical protein n=1 Tax=Dactylosporangium sp. CA-233914 TaxID=3239934 RepID=UPI003D8B4233
MKHAAADADHLVLADGQNANGLAFGPDGWLVPDHDRRRRVRGDLPAGQVAQHPRRGLEPERHPDRGNLVQVYDAVTGAME